MQSVDINDERFMSFVIDYAIPFPVMLKQAGLEGYTYEGKVYCPFHDNTSTPAAKMYKGDAKGDTLFCFSEQKIYRPSDVIKKKLINKSLRTIFDRIWKQCDDAKREELLGIYSKPVDYIPEAWKKNQEYIDKFKRGETTIEQHLAVLVASLD